MTLQTPTQIQVKPAYQPNDEQKARAAAYRRFNWFYVYIPLIFCSLIVLLFFGFMLWGVFSPRGEGTASFLSGMADMIVILFAVPITLLCASGPLAVGGLIYYTFDQRKKHKNLPPDQQPQGGHIQILLWRLDHLLDTLYAKIKLFLPKLTNPVIQINGFLAYVEKLLNRFRRFLTRS
jgi:hypothetical protein